ncbi:hypothetical protein C5F49_08855 [Nitrosopumilus oxyclinae]|uniref:Uncharacterized protein n=1 Tax=Nitrosopumilus oxyclinae TaxID=1959104 RepID=A0A7D5R5W5_9ARCH|nr:hypothetical protein [Nitrosopumilus oxyclinae]QLH05639.1 hypothetical protein C5F49_08855 [Nitrosopumilus oxyclinae]
MKSVNVLFVISTILVPLLLISLNYGAISDFYSYSVPLNSLVVDIYTFTDDPDKFQKTLDKKDSTCFTTLNDNFFCYEYPRVYEDSAISYVRGVSGIDGELHFDPIEKGVSYFTMKNMTVISGDTALVTLADKDYRVGNSERTDYEITDDFEFSAVLEKFDVFIAKCNNYEGTSVTLVQYLGVVTLEDKDYFATWHTPASSNVGVACNYPEIIEHSMKHDFGDM